MSVGQISGLVSGLDTTSLIDALITARSRPILLLEQRRSQKTAELAAWKSLETILLALKIETERLGEPGLWDGLATRTSDADHLSVSADTRTVHGSWDLFVERLAVAHQEESQAYASRDAVVGAGTLTLTIGGEATEIAVADGTTLAELVDLVNDADVGITAAVVRSEAAGVESFHIVLGAAETGEANRFVVDTSGLVGGTAPSFTTARTGDDAVLRFGGEGGLELRSSTNTFEDVVDGLDVTVLAPHATGEATSVTVERDTENLTDTVGRFVERYNAMIDFVNGQFAFDPEVGLRPPLLGSGTLTTIASSLRSRVLRSPAGSENATFRTLAGVGIGVDADGRLKLDESELRDALAEDFDAVANLFRTHAAGGAEGVEWLSAPLDVELDGREVRVEVTSAATRAEIRGDVIDLSGGLVIDASNDSFRIEIDGTLSEELTLAHGTYSSGDALAAALADAIDDSEDLAALTVAVSFEPEAGGGGRLVLTSTRWGSKGSIRLHESGSAFGTDTGLASVENLTARGADVAGTIDGVQATGEGRTLTVPDGGGELAGVRFRVTLEDASVPAEIDFTFGEGLGRVAGRRLRTLTDSAEGTLARLGRSLQSVLDRYARDIESKQEALEARRTRLERQYARLESTLAELTGQSQFISAQLQSLQSGFGTNRT